MLNLLHVYTSPNHGSLVFYSTDPRDPFTFVDPFDPRPMTDDPLTHCLLCFKVACLLALLIKLLIGPWWKFYHRCICAQGRTDYILEVIRLRIRIQDFLRILRHCEIWHFFHNLAHISKTQLEWRYWKTL